MSVASDKSVFQMYNLQKLCKDAYIIVLSPQVKLIDLQYISAHYKV